MKTKKSLYTLVLSLVLLTSLFFVPTAYAFDGREGRSITIGKDEVIADDPYLAADFVTVNGTIQGDLMVGASQVTINGTVEGDLWAASNSLVLNGSVGDDVFFAGAAATFGPDAQVKDDVFLANYSLETQPGSQIGGSVLMGAYQGLLSGDIGENIFAGVNRMRIEGLVGGDVKVDVANTSENLDIDPSFYSQELPSIPSIPSGLTLGNEAEIEGDLTYTSREEIRIARERIEGSLEHLLPRVEEEITSQFRNTPARMAAAWMFNNVRQTIAFLLVGVLLAWLLPAWVMLPANRLQTKPWPSLGWGIVIFLIFPFIILIAIGVVISAALLLGALTLGSLLGAVLSLGGTVIFATISIYALVLSFLTKAAVAYLGGRALLNRIQPQYAEKVIWPLLLGLVILAIIFAIPFLGGVAEFFVMIFGLGAIFLLLQERLTPTAKAVPVPSAE